MANNFTHVYLEQDAADYRLTHEILRNFSDSTVVDIGKYHEIFNRPNQAFRIQKDSLNLILAVKKDHFVYPGSTECQDSIDPNFHYSTPVINCIYDCGYCYLQGKYNSANLLVFVNEEDFFSAVEESVSRRPVKDKPLQLAISYDADLLAMDRRIPVSLNWIDFARRSQNLLIEIRTKSAWSQARGIEPSNNVLLSWSLSPDEIISTYESKTPGLDKRLAAAKGAIAAGWQVRICVDPVLLAGDWELHYKQLFYKIIDELPGTAIYDFQLGFFRMNKTYYKQARKLNPANKLYLNWIESGHQTFPYRQQEKAVFTELARSIIHPWLAEDKLEIWV